MTRAPIVLITGVSGFVGKHMASYLLSLGIRVVGTGRQVNSPISHTQFQYKCCDLTHSNQIHHLLNRNPVDYIIHLAGENDVATSFVQPVTVMQSNAFGTMQLLEAARLVLPNVLKAFLAVGTGYEYAKNAAPIKESSRIDPGSPYAWSKLVMTSIVQMYGQLYSMPVLIARTFNLIGPGGSAGVCAELVRQVVLMEQGQLPPKLVMGNAEVRRDFLDVRDAVKAYWSLLNMRVIQPGSIYNLCSGQAHSIAEIAAALKKHASIPFEVSKDEALIRKGESSVIRGDNSKLRHDTAWSPSIPLEQSIVDALNEKRSLFKEDANE